MNSSSAVQSCRLCLMLVAVLLFAACTAKQLPPEQQSSPPVSVMVEPAPQPPVSSPTPTAPSPQPVPVYRETGIATWYGSEFQGRKTASGQPFDMDALSAAHRTLPLGSVIQVTNLENSKSVTVTVNDRGPFLGNSMLAVSYAAARELGFAQQGVARVTIECPKPSVQNGSFAVQAAVFSEEENAQLLKDKLSARFERIAIIPFENNLGKFYRVRVGSYASIEKAQNIAAKLKLEGLEPYVIRKD